VKSKKLIISRTERLSVVLNAVLDVAVLEFFDENLKSKVTGGALSHGINGG
jgi:hypothetical protein